MRTLSLAKSIALAAFAAAVVLGGCSGMPASGRGLHDEAQLLAIPQGMAKDDVLRTLGPPDETMRFPASRTNSLDYLYYDTWGYRCLYSITFDEGGHVVSKISARLNDGGDHGSR
ncbi:MAG: outer membrane protein assembly factor BamE domain-containing protein [Usitatibacter sp.]